MGRSYSEMRPSDLGTSYWRVVRTRDPDDEFAQGQVLTEDFMFLDVPDIDGLGQPRSLRLPSKYAADLLILAWNAGRDSVHVSYN